ncbi:MAG: UGSC family (seleno)protein [Acidimicrobiia bacterium]
MSDTLTVEPATGAGTVWYHTPEGGVLVPDDPYELSMASFPGRLALVANSFPDSVPFLDRFEEVLRAAHPEVEVFRHAKANPSVVLTDEEVEVVRASADGVVTAYGHCGSCTSGTVRDAVKLARAGVPTVALVTEVFADAAGVVARSSGMSAVPRVVLPHPVARTTPERMAEIARGCLADVVGLLRS